jgi:hypothetical protein
MPWVGFEPRSRRPRVRTPGNRLVYTRPNYTSGQDDVRTRTEECLCVRSDNRHKAARELIVARSRDRPNYTNFLHYMLHYTLGSPSIYAALDRSATVTGFQSI